MLKRNAHRANSLWIVIQYWSTINIIRAPGVFEGLSTKHTQASTRRQPYSRCNEMWCGVLVRARAHTHYVSCTHHISHRSEPCMRADINHWLSSRQNTRLNSSSSLLKSLLTALYAIYRSSPHIHIHTYIWGWQLGLYALGTHEMTCEGYMYTTC